MGRAPCCDKANVKRGPWSPEEDVRLKTYIEEYGTGGNWIALPHKIGLKRCGKSCRLRWLNYLRPNIKHGGFSEEEDSLICNLYISIGSRWSVIAAQLPGRTDNDIKNYWNTRLKKKLLGRRKDSQSRRGSSNQEQSKVKKDAVDSAGNTSSRSLSASAVERMQLYIQLQGLNTPLSFYNNPAMWPKFTHPLGDHGIFQTHQTQDQHLPTDPHLRQLPIQTATSEPFPDMSLPSNLINGGKVSNTALEFDVNSLNGFSSESTSAILTTGETNDNFGSAAARLQEELSELFYGEKDGNLEQVQVCQKQQQEKLTVNQDLDCSKGILESAGYDNMNISWWANNDISQKSSSTSWDSNHVDLPTESIFQYFNWGTM